MTVKQSKLTAKHPGADDEPPKSPIWRAAHMQQAQELAPWCLTAEPPDTLRRWATGTGACSVVPDCRAAVWIEKNCRLKRCLKRQFFVEKRAYKIRTSQTLQLRIYRGVIKSL